MIRLLLVSVGKILVVNSGSAVTLLMIDGQYLNCAVIVSGMLRFILMVSDKKVGVTALLLGIQ